VVVFSGARDRCGPALEAFLAAGIDGERLAVVVPGDQVARSPRDLAALVAGAAGLALLGGGDPHPATYGEAPLPEGRLTLEPGRDELEQTALAAAREARVPTWGVCRGMQMINVFLGGSLWQDIPTQLPGALVHDLPYPRDALVHPVEVTAPETALGTLLARESCMVNSRHHQGIKAVAPALTPVAQAPDRLVEAYVLEGGEWWLEAVQWHPENLMAIAQQRAIVERFASAVAARDGRRGRLPSRQGRRGPGAPGRPAG
jgi:putative glutamine amidotransferase